MTRECDGFRAETLMELRRILAALPRGVLGRCGEVARTAELFGVTTRDRGRTWKH